MLIEILLIILVSLSGTALLYINRLINYLNNIKPYLDETYFREKLDGYSAAAPPADHEFGEEEIEEDIKDMLGSEALHIKNKQHEDKIRELMAELERPTNVRPGSVYDVPHEDIDKNYIVIPKEEYAE